MSHFGDSYFKKSSVSELFHIFFLFFVFFSGVVSATLQTLLQTVQNIVNGVSILLKKMLKHSICLRTLFFQDHDHFIDLLSFVVVKRMKTLVKTRQSSHASSDSNSLPATVVRSDRNYVMQSLTNYYSNKLVNNLKSSQLYISNLWTSASSTEITLIPNISLVLQFISDMGTFISAKHVFFFVLKVRPQTSK